MNHYKKKILSVALVIAFIGLLFVFLPKLDGEAKGNKNQGASAIGTELGTDNNLLNDTKPVDKDGNEINLDELNPEENTGEEENQKETDGNDLNNDDNTTNNGDENVHEEINNPINIDYYAESKSILVASGSLINNNLLSNDVLESMSNDLANSVLENHWYNEATEEQLYFALKNNNQYGISLLNHAYDELTRVKYDMEEVKIEQVITSKVETNVSEKENSPVYKGEAVVPDYIKKSYKKAEIKQQEVLGENIEKFRQYDVTVGLDVFKSPASTQAGNTDIVLLIDNSGSMINNFDGAIASAKAFVNEIIPDGYDRSSDESIKISVVSFAGDVEVKTELSNDKQAILYAIDNIRRPSSNVDNGQNGTNMQKALLETKVILEISDVDEISKDRKKSVVLFSDGNPTTRDSDFWTLSSGITEASSINVANDNTYTQGDKRWSYLINRSWGNSQPIAEKIYLPDGSSYFTIDSEAGLSGEFLKQQEFNKAVTLLEGQFLAHKGVNLYTVAFTDNSHSQKFLSDLSNPLTENPNLTKTDVNTNPLNEYTHYENDGYEYNSTNIDDFIEKIISDTPTINNQVFKSYEYVEELNNDFEFILNDFKISKDEFGKEILKEEEWANVKFDKNTLTWNFPDEFDEGEYFITYGIKVKDNHELFPNGADKQKYGDKANEMQSFTNKSKLSFIKASGEKFENDFASVKVMIQPILSIDFQSTHEAALAGELVSLMPKISKGTGLYEYEIYEKSTGKKNILKENEYLKIDPVSIYSDNISIQFANEGEYEYMFKVKDIISDITKEKAVKIIAKEGKLVLNIIDSGRKTDLEGAFETKINASNSEWEQDKTFYLNGLGSRVFRYSSNAKFLSKGTTIDVSTYVPYGYEIVSVEDSEGTNDGKVVIDMKSSSLGNLTGFEHDVTIRVKKIDKPKFFFDWKWIFGNKS